MFEAFSESEITVNLYILDKFQGYRLCLPVAKHCFPVLCSSQNQMRETGVGEIEAI